MKKLYRSRTNKVIGGVCGGIGEYFNIDPTIVRIIWILLFLLPPHFLTESVLYCALWAIVPKAPKE